MVVLGHFLPWIALHVVLFGGMMISATAGYLYGQDVAHGYGRCALAGAIAGGVCALLGLAVSVMLGDSQPFVLALGTAISTLAGAVGGVFGQMSASIRAFARKRS
jgi:Na+-transporting NADH:ubiquinone oxidoreductase subunit NqrE